MQGLTLVEAGVIRITKQVETVLQLYYVKEQDSIAEKIINKPSSIMKSRIGVYRDCIVERALGSSSYRVVNLGSLARTVDVDELRIKDIQFREEKEILKYYVRPIETLSLEQYLEEIKGKVGDEILAKHLLVMHARLSIIANYFMEKFGELAPRMLPAILVVDRRQGHRRVTAIKSLVNASIPIGMVEEPLPLLVVETSLKDVQRLMYFFLKINEDYFNMLRRMGDTLKKVDNHIKSMFVRSSRETRDLLTLPEKMILGLVPAELEEERGEEEKEESGSIGETMDQSTHTLDQIM